MKKVLMRADGRPMRWQDIYKELGVKDNRLPDRGVAAKYIQGIIVFVRPKVQGKNQDGSRTRAVCPHCGRDFAFDNLRQHFKVHERGEG